MSYKKIHIYTISKFSFIIWKFYVISIPKHIWSFSSLKADNVKMHSKNNKKAETSVKSAWGTQLIRLNWNFFKWKIFTAPCIINGGREKLQLLSFFFYCHLQGCFYDCIYVYYICRWKIISVSISVHALRLSI